MRWLVLLLIFASSEAYSNWTINIGWHKPIYSQYGLNLQYWGQKWMFEIGLSHGELEYLDGEDKNNKESDSDGLYTGISGDIDLKYAFLKSGPFALYALGGMAYYSAVDLSDDSDIDASSSELFFGAGLLIGTPSFHVDMGAYLQSELRLFAGLGFDI